jgi:hypothetical protein
MKKLIFPIILILIMAACVTPYYPNVTKYENLLVVDGQMTNLTGPYKVKLSRSYKYDSKAVIPVTGANIKIKDNNGLEVPLKEISDGTYSTVDTTFHGIPGKSYKLQIKVDNEIYESDFETIKTPIPIDKFYWEYKPLDGEGPKRVQLSLDTHDPTNKNRYYGWEYDETWKFIVPIDVVNPRKPEWKTCYQTGTSNFINLATTIERNNDVIDRQSMLSINESTNRLYMRYSILAKQYSFSEQTYKYIAELKKMNQNQGSLYDVTPYSLTSNIKCISNKNQPVVGYFIVAGASEKRIFIDRTDLPTEFYPSPGFEDCVHDMVLVDARIKYYSLDKKYDSLSRLGYSVYDTLHIKICKLPLPPPNIECTTIPGIQLFMAKSPCYNCTVTGENKVPAFWTEKK